jgi:hypothetical protein
LVRLKGILEVADYWREQSDRFGHCVGVE